MRLLMEHKGKVYEWYSRYKQCHQNTCAFFPCGDSGSQHRDARNLCPAHSAQKKNGGFMEMKL